MGVPGQEISERKDSHGWKWMAREWPFCFILESLISSRLTLSRSGSWCTYVIAESGCQWISRSEPIIDDVHGRHGDTSDLSRNVQTSILANGRIDVQ